MGKFWGIFRGKPDLGMAAKVGDPAMTTLMPSTPPGIQAAAAAAVEPTADVTVETISGPSALDSEPDARLNQPQTESSETGAEQDEQKLSPVATIFVADDNPHVHSMVEEALSAEGHEIAGTMVGCGRLGGDRSEQAGHRAPRQHPRRSQRF